MSTVVPLHKLGYCDKCAKPFRAGDAIAEPRMPDGSHVRIHAACFGAVEIDPEPPNGGTPAAIAA
jgi:hypothetical protein